MVSKDQSIGALILIVCVAVAIGYTFTLFWPTLEAIRIWIIGIPVLIGFIAVLAIGAWIGWTMATTPPPKPIEDIQFEETEAMHACTPVLDINPYGCHACIVNFRTLPTIVVELGIWKVYHYFDCARACEWCSIIEVTRYR